MNRFAYTGISSDAQVGLNDFIRNFDYKKYGMCLQEIKLAPVPRWSCEDCHTEELYVSAQRVIARVVSASEAPSDEFMAEFGAGAIVTFIQSVSLPDRVYEIRLTCEIANYPANCKSR